MGAMLCNFDEALKSMTLNANFTVKNKLTGDENRAECRTALRDLEDFEPEQVARRVEPLNELLELPESSLTSEVACRATRS